MIPLTCSSVFSRLTSLNVTEQIFSETSDTKWTQWNAVSCQCDSVLLIKHLTNICLPVNAVQKRVVNVYRLITRGTLEEKIMGLQKFKMSIANTVISQDNSSLQSMGTDQLLNLFTLDKVRPPSTSCQKGPETDVLVSLTIFITTRMWSGYLMMDLRCVTAGRNSSQEANGPF